MILRPAARAAPDMNGLDFQTRSVLLPVRPASHSEINRIAAITTRGATEARPGIGRNIAAEKL
jgi:hypothetical protein